MNVLAVLVAWLVLVFPLSGWAKDCPTSLSAAGKLRLSGVSKEGDGAARPTIVTVELTAPDLVRRTSYTEPMKSKRELYFESLYYNGVVLAQETGNLADKSLDVFDYILRPEDVVARDAFFPLAVGKSFSYSMSNKNSSADQSGGRFISMSVKDEGIISVGGCSYPVFIIERIRNMDSISAVQVTTDWYSPSLQAPLRSLSKTTVSGVVRHTAERTIEDVAEAH